MQVSLYPLGAPGRRLSARKGLNLFLEYVRNQVLVPSLVHIFFGRGYSRERRSCYSSFKAMSVSRNFISRAAPQSDLRCSLCHKLRSSRVQTIPRDGRIETQICSRRSCNHVKKLVRDSDTLNINVHHYYYNNPPNKAMRNANAEAAELSAETSAWGRVELGCHGLESLFPHL
jgi:hypothetical protein